jgi:hypothetical protein
MGAPPGVGIRTVVHPPTYALFWNAALPLKPPSHALVSEIDRIAEHERAAPDDTVDAARVTLANGLI